MKKSNLAFLLSLFLIILFLPVRKTSEEGESGFGWWLFRIVAVRLIWLGVGFAIALTVFK